MVDQVIENSSSNEAALVSERLMEAVAETNRGLALAQKAAEDAAAMLQAFGDAMGCIKLDKD